MNDTPAFREQRWPSADGLELYSRVYDAAGPDAPAVLCLPGLTRNSRDFEDLAFVDQVCSPRFHVSGARRRHLETSRGQSSAGSSLAFPVESRI